MSTLTPINGWSIPSLSDSPNITSAVNTAISAIDARVNPIFSTTAARNAAISVPTAGQECYVTGTKEKYLHNGTVWIGAIPRIIRKSVDESRGTTTTLANDTDLTVPVEANSVYRVYGQLQLRQSVVTADWKVRWTIPASATLTGAIQGNLGGGSDIWEESAGDMTATIVITSNSTNDQVVKYSTILTVAGTSGSLTFQWAQNVSTGSNNTVRKDSFIEILKIG